MAYGKITVTGAPTLICAANCLRKVLSIVNTGNDDLWIAPDSSLTTASGFLISGGVTRDMSKVYGGYFLGDLYGIAETATNIDVRYWEVSQMD